MVFVITDEVTNKMEMAPHQVEKKATFCYNSADCLLTEVKNMFYEQKTFEKIWWEREEGVPLHTLSGTKASGH